MKTLLIAAIFLFAAQLHGADVYLLNINMPEMPEGKRSLERNAEISKFQSKITLRTTGMSGNEILLESPMRKDGRVIFGINEIERGNLITLFLIGNKDENGSMEGDMKIFQNGILMTQGSFSLTPKAAQQDDSTGAADAAP